MPAGPSEMWSNVETNRPETDVSGKFNYSICTFDSDAADSIPDPYYATEYNKFRFVYDRFGFTNPGSGDWGSSSYPTGIGYAERYGIGAFYFYVPVPNLETPGVKPDVPCYEPEIQGRVFWDYLSTFWDFLSDDDRANFETFWNAMTKAGYDLLKKGLRFFETTAPENARTCVLEDYFDLLIGPLHSKPINLDPTLKIPNYIIRPIGTKLIEPVYDSALNPHYFDMIELSAADYYKIRDIGFNQYLVVKAEGADIGDKYFKINNLLSSEEKGDRPASVEMNENSHYEEDSTIGRLRLIADDPSEDVSEYNVFFISEDIGGTSEVYWFSNGIVISVDPADKTVDAIVTLINTPHVDKWCSAINISPKDKDNCPAILHNFETYPVGSVSFESLENYIYSEESDGRHYNPTGKKWIWFEGYSSEDGTPGDSGKGEWVNSLSAFKYMIEVQGDLSYLFEKSFTIYLTTGRAYDVANYIKGLPILQNFINQNFGVPFYQDIDYRFYNNTVEFFNNIFELKRATPNEYLYCPKAELIEHMLFEMYGSMVNVSNWDDYNYTNIGGKAGINSLLKSLQNVSNLEDYERALNVYYGMPVAPERAEVQGLYESYGYKVLAINSSNVTVELPDDEPLHPFIQEGGKFLIEGKKEKKIDVVIDRALGIILLDDVSDMTVGDLMYLKLNNRFIIKSFYAEDIDAGIPGYIDVYIPEGSAPIQHVVNMLQLVTDGEQYPEILIYGTEELSHNYNGIYHITDAVQTGGIVRLTVYERNDSDVTIYNDYIGVTTEDIGAGYAHFSWPTHKFLYLYLDTQKNFKAYLDAPIDTIYDVDDVLNKYQIIARNVSVVNKTLFPGWVQFDHFRRYNGINLESDILELTHVVPGAKFGEYFPSAGIRLE